MPISQALVTRYFQLILSRQFAEVERELERVKQKMQKTDWNRGYFRALYGIYLSRKNSATDDYAFFAKIDLSDKVRPEQLPKRVPRAHGKRLTWRLRPRLLLSLG